MPMNWILQRYSDDRESTLGLLFKEFFIGPARALHYFCDVLEDEFRQDKVPGETRIPAGRYQLVIRREETPLTLRHRRSYGPWFKFHIEITGIPNFNHVYVHAGNTDRDTAGCLLLGYGATRINGVQEIQHSRLAVREWYGQVYDHLDGGGKAFIEIRDENAIT